jgi:putative membrane protein
MRTLKILLFCHIAALVFGLGGLLIALPHPEWWNNSATGVTVFNFGMRYAGSLHILFGAATMFLFGLLFVGTRKTLTFFFASTLISLSMELLGTSTGFPFGPYAYTNLLGYKIFGYVPYSIPLSWFYMGFASYLLACLIVKRLGWRRAMLWSLLLGSYFLTVWDLSLDPAMASERLPIHFWIWNEPGPYFGMPVQNLIGWSITGLFYMSVSRLLWGSPLNVRRITAWLPFVVYAANSGFAIALALGAGIWEPSIIAVLLGLLPATLAFLPAVNDANEGEPANTIVHHMAHLTIHRIADLLTRRKVVSEVYGLDHIPEHGPVMIVARHFHHAYDGCILLQALPRHLHFLVALDWIQQRWLRAVMERACDLAHWPVILRKDNLTYHANGRKSAYQTKEAMGYLRRAATLTVKLLRKGETVVIFPEAYPVIDPSTTHRSSSAGTEQPDDILPFRHGFAQLIKKAEQDGQTRVAIVPLGMYYNNRDGRWHATLRIGEALTLQDLHDTTQLVQVVEQRVQELSRPQTVSHQTQEGAYNDAIKETGNIS